MVYRVLSYFFEVNFVVTHFFKNIAQRLFDKRLQMRLHVYPDNLQQIRQ
jgi:hypothetical protein